MRKEWVVYEWSERGKKEEWLFFTKAKTTKNTMSAGKFDAM